MIAPWLGLEPGRGRQGRRDRGADQQEDVDPVIGDGRRSMDLGPTCARFGEVNFRVRRRLSDDEPIKLRMFLPEQEESPTIDHVEGTRFGYLSDRLSPKGFNNPPRLFLRDATLKIGPPLAAGHTFALVTFGRRIYVVLRQWMTVLAMSH